LRTLGLAIKSRVEEDPAWPTEASLKLPRQKVRAKSRPTEH